MSDPFENFRSGLGLYKTLTKAQLKEDMERRYMTGNAYPSGGALWIDLHHRELDSAICDMLHSHVLGKSVLELGCGSGGVAAHKLREEALSIVGTDLSETALNVARDFFKQFANIEYKQMDAEHLAFEDQSFDIAIAKEVLEHLPEPATCVREVARVLRPGGLFVLSSPNTDSLHLRVNRFLGREDFPCSGDHLSEMSFEQMVKCLEGCGFQIVSAKGVTLMPYHYVKEVFPPEVQTLENDNLEFCNLMRVLGERAGPEFAFCYVICARIGKT